MAKKILADVATKSVPADAERFVNDEIHAMPPPAA